VIRHHGREARLDLRCADVSEVAWAAFYADCVHEVLPITSGCRLVLVYNLRRKGRERLPRPPSYDKETAALERLLRAWFNETAKPDEDRPHKLVYPLAHAYTPAELSFAALKGADAAAATVLTAAAGDAACDLHVALLRIEESGAAEYNGYSGRSWHTRYHDEDSEDDHDESDDEFRVAEVFDRALTLSDWTRPDGGVASLGALPFCDGEVCPPDALADMEPDEQHIHEATGNEGASFERSYQRAALVLWPHAKRLRLIARAGLAASMPALDGMFRAWIDGGAESGHPVWHEAHALAAEMLACWPVQAARRGHDGPSAESVMLSQLVRLQDRELIESMLINVVAAGAYAAGDNAALVQSLKLLPASRVGALLLSVVQGNADLHIGGCADLLARIAAVAVWRGQMLGAARALLDAMPGDTARPQSPADAWRRERADAGVIHDTLRALAPAGHAGLSALADRAVTHWLAWPKTYGMDAVIVPALRRLADRPALLNRPAGRPAAAGGGAGPPARAVLTGLGTACRLAARGPHELPLRALPGTGPLPAECRPGGLALQGERGRTPSRRGLDPSGPARRRLQHRAQGQPARAGVHQEPGELRAQGCAATGGPRRSDAAQGVVLLGRAAHWGETPWSSHHRRAIASIACRS